jgi:hypothetical protein
MRTLLRATFDTNASNKAIIDGSIAGIIKSTMDYLHPESAYFGTIDGCRACFIVFDLKDPSDIPVIAEPLFSHLNAKVELSPVMNPTDLQKGLEAWGKSQAH